MNKSELKKKLDALKIRPDVYHIEDGLPTTDEVLVLEDNYGRWSVYYYERGNRSSEKKFSDENEACGYFYEQLEKEPNARIT